MRSTDRSHVLPSLLTRRPLSTPCKQSLEQLGSATIADSRYLTLPQMHVDHLREEPVVYEATDVSPLIAESLPQPACTGTHLACISTIALVPF